MKKIIALLFVISLILVGCSKDEFYEEPKVEVKGDIFDGDEYVVTDGQLIKFNLSSDGVYTLTMQTETGVISRERFVGKAGKNELNIYTNVLNISRFDLILSDENGNVVDRVLVTNKTN
jgi:hypothetical protein